MLGSRSEVHVPTLDIPPGILHYCKNKTHALRESRWDGLGGWKDPWKGLASVKFSRKEGFDQHRQHSMNYLGTYRYSNIQSYMDRLQK